MLLIFSGNQEAFDHQIHVKFKWFTINLASHNFDHLVSEFEVCPFESQVTSWRNIKNETEINMNNVSLFFVYKNVAIMSVLYLQDVRYYWVSCLRFYKILTRFLENTVIFWTEVADKKLVQRFLISLSNWISGYSFRNNLNDTSYVKSFTCPIWDCFIRKQFEV